MNMYVGNLSYSVTEDELRSMFTEYGDVVSAKLIMDRETGRSKGFGFVEMSNNSEAQKAMEDLNGNTVDGRALTVNQARPREDRSRGGGGGGSKDGDWVQRLALGAGHWGSDDIVAAISQPLDSDIPIAEGENAIESDGSKSLPQTLDSEHRISLLKDLAKAMRQAAQALDFERAAALRDRIYELEQNMD